ncbi:acyl transferase domain-containing protein [Mucilaginibacter oryzae]|uniref:Acyl transferase domain-containing protein n=1 Tax=Mucilaginibacter oryzae TaxID=468058 RepID=A0A316GWB9_9SPHI|nr:type I polyketide synthase [Mucilaginibacter oryzae]PWK65011.1 acyl transferase domain-containing protein [Mucilaginibacter oryzae]
MKKDNYSGLEVAIIGMACRFPGARNWREFWQNLQTGVESIEITEVTRAGGLNGGDDKVVFSKATLSDKEMFDPAFFGYRPEEAGLMNPLHRILHECIYEALEDAACDPSAVKGPISLFAGGNDDFNWKLYAKLVNREALIDDFNMAVVTNKDFLSSLLSYKLNLNGPSVYLNTACSTSLVAVNMACKSLLLGESRIALAGGVSVITQEGAGATGTEGSVFSKDGHCRAFDQDASGTVGGEGAGVIVLKRLSDAIADGDHIYSIIKGSAINNDGNRKVSFAAPSVEGQAECLRAAYRFARVDPASVSFVEGHGTGTRLGDPIEVEALNLVFNGRRQPCALGSVKSNIGHLDSAAGLAGLIKACLSLKYRKIPATLNFVEPNPEINFKEGPFFVNDSLLEWKNEDGIPRRAGVSSFGVGGTNAHVVLEEYQEPDNNQHIFDAKPPGKPYVVNVSAKTDSALLGYLNKLAAFVRSNDVSFDDMSYTLDTGRANFPLRRSVVFNTREEFLKALDANDRSALNLTVPDRSPEVIFMFPGQGAQYARMCLTIYRRDNFFRDLMDKGLSYLELITPDNYRNALFSDEVQPDWLSNTSFVQPLIFLVEYVLAKTMMHYGVKPSRMIGHSVGEYTCACLAGVLTFESALDLVVGRAKVMQHVSEGRMLSAQLIHDEAKNYLNETISLAAVNSTDQVVFSGSCDAIIDLQSRLGKLGIACVLLNVKLAFHSHLLEPVLADFHRLVEKISFEDHQIPYVSNVTGGMITENEYKKPGYWVKHMRDTVWFDKGLSLLYNGNDQNIFVEIGPGNILSRLAHKKTGRINAPNILNLITAKDETSGVDMFQANFGKLWSLGVPVNWRRFYTDLKPRKISLPTYAFDQMKFPTVVNPFNHGLYLKDQDNQAISTVSENTLYLPTWKKYLHNHVASPGKKTLLFSGNDDSSQAVLKGLIEREASVLQVSMGDAFRAGVAGGYTVNPFSLRDFELLFNEINRVGAEIETIIYLWPVVAVYDKHKLTSEGSAYTFEALSHIIKTIVSRKEFANVFVKIFTASMYEVFPEDKTGWMQALLIGLNNVLVQEYTIKSQIIDVSDSWQSDIPVLCEHALADFDERSLAIRHGQLWVPDFQAIRNNANNQNIKVKEGKHYLLTGGLGRVAVVIAEHLLRNTEASIVLLGRSDLASETVKERFNKLSAISSKVHYFSTDVTKIELFEPLLQRIEDELGPIAGIVHAAGEVDLRLFETIEDMTQENVTKILAPKALGLENIIRLFGQRDLDFMIATSSVSTILGGLGYGAYSAANALMEARISSIQKSRPTWKSIAFSEMYFDAGTPRNGAGMQSAIGPGEIATVFDIAVQLDTPHIIQSVENIWRRRERVFEERGGIKLNEADSFLKVPTDISPEFFSSTSGTEEYLLKMIAGFFGINTIAVTDNFFDLGGDSLRAMVVIKRIKAQYKVTVGLEDFFNMADLRQLAELIDQLQEIRNGDFYTNEIII